MQTGTYPLAADSTVAAGHAAAAAGATAGGAPPGVTGLCCCAVLSMAVLQALGTAGQSRGCDGCRYRKSIDRAEHP